MDTPRPPKVFEHAVSGESVLPILKTLLPHPLPVYRRLQHPFRTEHSHVLATFAPPHDDAPPGLAPPQCFAVAYFDRSRRPETECWMFLSGEVPGRCAGPAERIGEKTNGELQLCESEKEVCRNCMKALYAMLEYIAKLPTPPSAHDAEDATAAAAAGKEGVDAPNKPLEAQRAAYTEYLEHPHVVKLGAVSRLVRTILHRALLAPRGYTGMDWTYTKYLLSLDSVKDKIDEGLPAGLTWGKVQEKDFALVASSTSVPRKATTLRQLASLAIFPSPSPENLDPEPIAWGFLGLDSSLSSLHVEPSHRGQGLAKKLAAKLFRDGHAGCFDVAGEDGGGIAHADAGGDNDEGNGVFRSLGGKEGWTVYWIRVDLDRIKEPLSRGDLEAFAALDRELPKRERIWEKPPYPVAG